MIPSVSYEVFTKVSGIKEQQNRTQVLQSDVTCTDLLIHSLICLLFLFMYVFVCDSQRTTPVSFIGHPLLRAFLSGLELSKIEQLASKSQGSSSLHLLLHYHCNYKTVPPDPDFYMGSGDPNSWPHTCRAGTLLNEPSSQTIPPIVFLRQDLIM